MAGTKEKSVNQEFDLANTQVKCLSLEDRVDRRYVISKRFPRNLLNKLEFHYGETFESCPDWFCGTLSSWSVQHNFQTILEGFLKSDKESLLCFEDDALLLNEYCFLSELKCCVDSLPEGWDCLFLGGFQLEPSKYVNLVLDQCTYPVDHECMFWSRSGAKKHVEYLKGRKFAYNDRALAYWVKKGDVKAYCPKSPLSIQGPYSSNNFGNKSKHPRLNFLKDCSLTPDEQMCLYAFLKDKPSVYVDPQVGDDIFNFIQPLSRIGYNFQHRVIKRCTMRPDESTILHSTSENLDIEIRKGGNNEDFILHER